MKIENPQERLKSLWGVIDQQHNELILSRIKGKRVLDAGCGYGSLVDHLHRSGFEVEGWDHDPESVAVAANIFPGAPVRLADLESERPAEAFDSIVLKDSLHHLVGEGDVAAAFSNIRRLLKQDGRLVILDPNPMWILRTARKLAAHLDPEAPVDVARRLLHQNGFVIRGIDYYEVIGLPLSGGYVGVRLVPNWRPVNQGIAWLNGLLSRVANLTGLAPRVCWRYVISCDVGKA